MVSSQQSTQGYTPNTTPYSSQSSQVTVSMNGSSSQPANVDEVQSLKIEISKVRPTS
jgi:glucan phosphoethanolaminetransferase (alkaline phosphatase superfamily)